MDSEKDYIDAYVTRYALTRGIMKVRGSLASDRRYLTFGEGFVRQVIGPGDWTADPKEAIKQAEAKRHRRIKALGKSVANVETLVIKLPEDAA